MIGCLRRGPEEPDYERFLELDEDEDEDDSPRRPRIRCPKCGWEPGRLDRWGCICGHAWNTFDTGGICPACDAKWADTQCLACTRWSPHHAWYEDEDRPD